MTDAPYTGTTSAAPVADAPAPRIRWGWMALVHFAAAFLAGLAFPVLSTALDPQWILIGIVSGFVVAVVAGGLTFGLARLGHYVATRSGRGWLRETVGVSAGPLLAAALLGVLFVTVAGTFGFGIVAIAGLGSAIGLSVWILVAWAPHLQNRPVR